MLTRPCKFCGKPLIWAIDDKGQKIPLDPGPPTYGVIEETAEGPLVQRAEPKTVMVIHMATCTEWQKQKQKKSG